MTIDKFKELIGQRYAVICGDIYERNAVLELLIYLGYEVNNSSMEYLKPGNTSDRFLHPVMNQYGDEICCRRIAHPDGNNVYYAEIADLVESSESSIDDRSSDEFSQDFSVLMC